MLKATTTRRWTGVQAKRERTASVSIEAVLGSTLRGSSAQRLAKEILPTSAMSSWDFALRGRCREMRAYQ